MDGDEGKELAAAKVGVRCRGNGVDLCVQVDARRTKHRHFGPKKCHLFLCVSTNRNGETLGFFDQSAPTGLERGRLKACM